MTNVEYDWRQREWCGTKRKVRTFENRWDDPDYYKLNSDRNHINLRIARIVWTKATKERWKLIISSQRSIIEKFGGRLKNLDFLRNLTGGQILKRNFPLRQNRIEFCCHEFWLAVRELENKRRLTTKSGAAPRLQKISNKKRNRIKHWLSVLSFTNVTYR